MKKFAAMAVIPLFAGYLFAQSETTTTTTTTMNGTLVDLGCYTTKTQSTNTSSDVNSSTRTETTKYVTECPVTQTTTTFGMYTPAGQVIRFDDAGNTRVVEMVKTNRSWNEYVVQHKPVKVKVVGSRHGDIVTIKEIR